MAADRGVAEPVGEVAAYAAVTTTLLAVGVAGARQPRIPSWLGWSTWAAAAVLFVIQAAAAPVAWLVLPTLVGSTVWAMGATGGHEPAATRIRIAPLAVVPPVAVVTTTIAGGAGVFFTQVFFVLATALGFLVWGRAVAAAVRLSRVSPRAAP